MVVSSLALLPFFAKLEACSNASGKQVRMGSLGMQEIIVLFVIALIVFGPRKLPEIGKTLGKGLAEFKKASNELKQTWEDEVQLDKAKQSLDEIVSDSTIKPSEVLNDITKSLEPESKK
jgi:TatA/E family protein of Tat protein translocase